MNAPCPWLQGEATGKRIEGSLLGIKSEW